MKLREKKGFTLAELLVVVAIIAVLVGISIPIFTAQLEKAKEGKDLANLRNAYAEASVEVLDGTKDESTREVVLSQKGAFEKIGDGVKIGGVLISGETIEGTATITVTLQSDGTAKTTIVGAK